MLKRIFKGSRGTAAPSARFQHALVSSADDSQGGSRPRDPNSSACYNPWTKSDSPISSDSSFRQGKANSKTYFSWHLVTTPLIAGGVSLIIHEAPSQACVSLPMVCFPCSLQRKLVKVIKNSLRCKYRGTWLDPACLLLAPMLVRWLSFFFFFFTFSLNTASHLMVQYSKKITSLCFSLQ